MVPKSRLFLTTNSWGKEREREGVGTCCQASGQILKTKRRMYVKTT